MRDGIPIDPSSVPDEARRMLALIETHKDHPLIKNHFFQITIITMIVPGGGPATMFLPDCRDGLYAALFWDDAEGNWGSGGWIPVAHEGADVTCPPSAFSIDYMQNNPAFPTAAAVMDHLYRTRPSIGSG
jgi:hypothetical protein